MDISTKIWYYNCLAKPDYHWFIIKKIIERDKDYKKIK
jgi:hypothetical protein